MYPDTTGERLSCTDGCAPEESAYPLSSLRRGDCGDLPQSQAHSEAVPRSGASQVSTETVAKKLSGSSGQLTCPDSSAPALNFTSFDALLAFVK